MSESSGLQPTDQPQPQTIDQSTHHVIAMPDGNTIALPKSLSSDAINGVASMYHKLTNQAGEAAGALSESFGLPSTLGEAKQAVRNVPSDLINLDKWKQVGHQTGQALLQPSDPALLDSAKVAWQAGDKTAAATHFMNYMLPFIGSGSDRSGEDLKHGDYGKAVGHVSAAILPFLFGSPEEGAITSEAEAAKAATRQFTPKPEPKPFQGGGEEGVLRSGKGRKGLGGGKPEDKYHPDVVGPKLLEKYGKSDGDPAHTAAILPDGTGVAMPPGAIHDEMLGGKATDVPAPRDVFVRGGGIRMRSYGAYGDRSFNMSLPKDGITSEQLENLKRMAPQMGSGKVYVEVPGYSPKEVSFPKGTDPETLNRAVGIANIEYGRASSELEPTIRSLVPIKGEPEMNPEPHPFAEMRAQHLKNGGATFSADGSKNLEGKDAWSVGVHPDRTETATDAEFTPERIKQFADKNADLLRQPDHAIGTWKDPDTGQHVLDVPKLIKDTDEAKAAGAAADQKAIFHLKSHELAQTGGTGGTALEDQMHAKVGEMNAAVARQFGASAEKPATVEPEATSGDLYPRMQAKIDEMNAAVRRNASGESAASLEDQSRLRSQQIQGLRLYDVDSRKAGSPDAWQPLPAVAGRADQVAQPFHHVVQVGADGIIMPVSSGAGARPLPSDAQVRAMLQGESENTPRPNLTPYEKIQQTTPEYRAGLTAKQISPRYTEGATAPTLGRTAMDEAGKAAPSKVGENGETKLGYTDKMGLTLSKYANEGLNHEGKTAPQVIDDTIKHYTGNLSALWDAIPDSIKRTSQKWYEAAHGLTSEISRKTGVPHEKVAGVVSVFSPKNDWNNNLGNAGRFIQRYQDSRGHAWTDAMDDKLTELRNLKRAGVPQPAEFKKALDFIRGKRYDEIKATDSLMKRDPEKAAAAVQAGKALWLRLVDETEGADQTPVYSPEGEVRASMQHNWGSLGPMTKALQILEGDGSPESIGEAIGRGHKTRNFYNNIINPWSEDGHLTIDTHAVRAAHLKAFDGHSDAVSHNFGYSNKDTPQPPSNAPVGIKGTYPIHEEAYRNVAKEKGVRPNQAQSVIWEGIQSLLGEKPQEHAQALNDIWRQVGDGKMTVEQARQEIINAVGGFKKPEWMPQEEWDADESRAESFNFGGK